MSHDELVAAALNLDRRERAALARKLLSSLDGSDHSTTELEEIWIEESERRREQVLAGEVIAIPAKSAFHQVRKALD